MGFGAVFSTGSIDSLGYCRRVRCAGSIFDSREGANGNVTPHFTHDRMIVRQFSWGLRGDAPAKLNLSLEVLAKRNDGFHEIETFMVPVNLYDTLYFRPNQSGQIEFSVSWQRHQRGVVEKQLPLGTDNLVVQAMEAIRARVGRSVGAAVHLSKRIPTEAGLGGGSSDAACALVVANRGWRAGLAKDDLVELAARIGSDVPFFLEGLSAICRGRGEEVEPVATRFELEVVVVKPPEGLSTPVVYREVKVQPGRGDARALVECLLSGDRRKLAQYINNDLEKPAADETPWIGRLREDMNQSGCVAHRMTGSGSAYFGICHHRRHASAVAGRMRSKGYERVYQLQCCRH